MWNHEYSWEADGDEWSDQAGFCKVPYPRWKASIIETLIRPNLHKGSMAVELAPGHGRWSGHIASMAGNVALVDMSPGCIEHCRKKFSALGNISYFINDGKSLPFIGDSSVDFIFSFDSFVHIEKEETASYLSEFARVLKKGGRAVIHHPGRRHSTLSLGGILLKLSLPGRLAYGILTTGRLMKHYGMRANISRESFALMAGRSGLKVVSQFDSWGKEDEFNVKLFRDCITILEK